jgi:hypothetical protein
VAWLSSTPELSRESFTCGVVIRASINNKVSLLELFVAVDKRNCTFVHTRIICSRTNTENSRYMLVYWHMNAGQNHNTKIANKTAENISMFSYFGTTIKIKFAFRRILRGDYVLGMLYAAQFIASHLTVCCLNT